MARKKTITAKQRAARRRNMEIARRAKKKGIKKPGKPWKPKVLGGQNKLNRFLRTKGGGWIKNPIYK
jgi:hypothetical protein